MTEKDRTAGGPDDHEPPEDWQQRMADMAAAADSARKLIAEWLEAQKAEHGADALDPFGVGEAFLALTSELMKDPARLAERQLQL
ncbi:MAG: hypothetical protein D6807_05120, partial [Alphaproteobacteria bacterium]